MNDHNEVVSDQSVPAIWNRNKQWVGQNASPFNFNHWGHDPWIYTKKPTNNTWDFKYGSNQLTSPDMSTPILLVAGAAVLYKLLR